MQHYSDELKAKILTEFKQKQSVTTLSKQYIISRTTIYRWLKETEIAESIVPRIIKKSNDFCDVLNA